MLPGYWQTTYWAYDTDGLEYWDENYWPHYGAPAAPTGDLYPVLRRRRRKRKEQWRQDDEELLLLL